MLTSDQKEKHHIFGSFTFMLKIHIFKNDFSIFLSILQFFFFKLPRLKYWLKLPKLQPWLAHCCTKSCGYWFKSHLPTKDILDISNTEDICKPRHLFRSSSIKLFDNQSNATFESCKFCSTTVL